WHDADAPFAGLRRTLRVCYDIFRRRRSLLRVRGDDEGVGVRCAGDAHLAGETAHVALGGFGRIIIERIPVRALCLLLPEKFVEQVLDIDGADVFERVDFWRETVIAYRLV